MTKTGKKRQKNVKKNINTRFWISQCVQKSAAFGRKINILSSKPILEHLESSEFFPFSGRRPHFFAHTEKFKTLCLCFFQGFSRFLSWPWFGTNIHSDWEIITGACFMMYYCHGKLTKAVLKLLGIRSSIISKHQLLVNVHWMFMSVDWVIMGKKIRIFSVGVFVWNISNCWIRICKLVMMWWV